MKNSANQPLRSPAGLTKGATITEEQQKLKAFAHDLHIVIEFIHVVKKYVAQDSDSWHHLDQLEGGFAELEKDVEEDLYLERSAEEAAALTAHCVDASDLGSLQTFLDSLYTVAMTKRGAREHLSTATSAKRRRRPM